MADLLLSLKGVNNQTPFTILQAAFTSQYKEELVEGNEYITLIREETSPIIGKIIKTKRSKVGFSLNDIVSLGNQIEFTNLSSSTVQNWVKRDVKELIGSPQLGKKYSIEQAALLFIVEDLKSALDFTSIRKILTLVFNNPADRSDDVINPIDLYGAYSSIFEKIHHQYVNKTDKDSYLPLNANLEQFIKDESLDIIKQFETLSEEQKTMVMNVLIITSLSVQSAYYQTLTQRHLSATLFA
jgi:hypothetical protein